MATVIGDYVSDPSHFRTMISSSSLQHQQDSAHYHPASRPLGPSSRRLSTSPRYQRRPQTTPSERFQTGEWESESDSAATVRIEKRESTTSGGASRFPSPPSSSSPSASSSRTQAQNGKSPVCMASDTPDLTRPGHIPSTGPSATPASPRRQQPSPPVDTLDLPDTIEPYHASGAASPKPPQGQTIRVRDLAHIQSLARADLLTGNGPGILNDPPLQQMKYEISGMPIGDIIEMVAALLTKITTTNDLQHDAMQRNVTHQQQANQNSESGSGSQMSPLSTSVLAFHGKNVPAITILSYLSRIHKYCPTTYEVFLSLLVYFDRMTERVNDMVTKNEEAKRLAALNPPEPSAPQRPASPPAPHPQHDDTDMQDDSEGSDEMDSDLADDDDDDDEEMEDGAKRKSSGLDGEFVGKVVMGTGAPTTASGPATYFVVDSFNIHRLIIAGVTCASKFFSDVFYTNSRYAKVGGLPLAELNHLELQFLLLNDFRLAVPVEDLEAYATMLVEFYAREVVAQRSRPVVGMD